MIMAAPMCRARVKVTEIQRRVALLFSKQVNIVKEMSLDYYGRRRGRQRCLNKMGVRVPVFQVAKKTFSQTASQVTVPPERPQPVEGDRPWECFANTCWERRCHPCLCRKPPMLL